MQIGFFPRQNAAHRLACLTLYKALLKRCSELRSHVVTANPQSSRSSHALQSLVRYRFQHDKRLKHWQQIRDALHFGREVLELLEEVNTGSHKALMDLTHVLSTTTSFAARNIDIFKQRRAELSERRLPRMFTERKNREAHQASKSNYIRTPAAVPVLDRPVPYDQALKHNDGRRKVPDYFVVQNIPFLRYTRHQPLSLSRYLRDQIVKHERLWENGKVAEDSIAMAEHEDKWDTRLRRDHKVYQCYTEDYDGQHRTWADIPRTVLSETNEKITKLDEARIAYGKKLWTVYLKEAELARTENAQRKEEGRQKWQDKQPKKKAKGEEKEKDRKDKPRVAAPSRKKPTRQDRGMGGNRKANFQPR